MDTSIAFVKKAFKITHFPVMIFFLQHLQEGLKPGTILTSKISGLNWEIKSRVFASYAFENQKIFEGEGKLYVHCSLSGDMKLEEARLKILNEEKQSIYQYTAVALGHEDKPAENEELIIVAPQHQSTSSSQS